MGQTAEELLDSLTDEQIAAYTADPTNEEHIVVGADRFVSVPDSLKRIAVQFDHDIETVTFDCPRYWDGHDMSKMAIYINYMRPDNARGSYPVTDICIDETDENVMHFNWTISGNVTEVKGVISFLVCVKKADSEGLMVNHWNSELNREMSVSEGLECADSIFEQYPDLITQLLLKMDELGKLLVISDNGEGDVVIEGLNTTLNICEAFDTGKTYSVGEYVLQYGMMYKCISPVEAPGMWKIENWSLCNVMDEVKECFQYVSDGKMLIASAIIDMGVQTEATDTFEQMATNIRSISTGVVPEGTAQPEDVTLGKTFKNSTGQLLTGTSTAVADLIELQHSYDSLESEYDGLDESYNALEASYNEYKNAVVNGLKYSGLGVTLYTTASELENLLLKVFPPSQPYSVNFADYPISVGNNCTVGLDAKDPVCNNNDGKGFYLSVTDDGGLNNYGSMVCTVKLPTNKCNTVKVTYSATGILADGVEIGSQTVTVDGSSHTVTFNCSGDAYELTMRVVCNDSNTPTTLSVSKIEFYNA